MECHVIYHRCGVHYIRSAIDLQADPLRPRRPIVIANVTAMDTRPLFLLVLTMTAFHVNRSAELDELDEIYTFVQTVLATGNRSALGLPDQPPARQYAPVVDGQLPTDLQRYLERLVSVSSVADKQTLVAMLWDDSLVVDEDQEPHDVFDQLYRGRTVRKGSGTPSPAVIRRSETVTESADDNTANGRYQTTRGDNQYTNDL